ncbi:MAG: hypothetical protein WC554_13850 [Clostridia bacterium]
MKINRKINRIILNKYGIGEKNHNRNIFKSDVNTKKIFLPHFLKVNNPKRDDRNNAIKSKQITTNWLKKKA